jgi:uncharacterized protein
VTNDVLTMEGLRRRAEILGVARKRRASRIAVFGSAARGEAHPDSDLDLLVDFEPGASLLDHIGLFQDLEDLLASEWTSSHGVPSRLATITFAPRPWICDQKSR